MINKITLYSFKITFLSLRKPSNCFQKCSQKLVQIHRLLIQIFFRLMSNKEVQQQGCEEIRNIKVMELDQQSLGDRIKNFIVQNSQFRDPRFDPAPFLIQILKQKQSDQEAIQQRRQDLIELQNEAFQIIDQICNQHSEELLNLLSAPQRQGQQLEKLKSNMSMVKKKTKQTKSLLMNTQKDINQVYLSCVFNKTVYRKLKEVEMKLHQLEVASLALRNNEFLNCSMNLPCVEGHSILESALDMKAQNLRLQLLSRGIQQVQLFLYLTPKIVLPASQSLIERISPQKSIFCNLQKHQTFFKRYNLFKHANCLQFLPTLWDFKQLQMKKGKIHLMYDIIKGALNIGKVQEILESLEVDCKKSIKSIFLLVQYYFSIQVEEEGNKQSKLRKDYNVTEDNGWFLCHHGDTHMQFISVVMNITGVMLRKLIILRSILTQYQIHGQQLSNLQLYTFFEIILRQVNDIIFNLYIREDIKSMDYSLQEEIVKKIRTQGSYIYWASVRNVLTKSLIVMDQNVDVWSEEFAKKKLPKPKWDEVVQLNSFDLTFYKNFHLDFNKALQEIFSHSGKSFAFESLEQICSSKRINESQINFYRYFSPQEMRYSKEFIFTISLFADIQRFFTHSGFDDSRRKKYQLYLISIMYLKLNYYLQRFFISNKALQKAFQLRRTSNKLKTKQKDLRRQLENICVSKKLQISVKPWRKSTIMSNQQVQQSTYRLVQNLKGIQKQTQMFLSYCNKNMRDIGKQLILLTTQRCKEQVQNITDQFVVLEKLQPANYDENFSSKLVRVWDQLPEIETSIMELTVCVLQKLIQLHMVVLAVVYLQSQVVE